MERERERALHAWINMKGTLQEHSSQRENERTRHNAPSALVLVQRLNHRTCIAKISSWGDRLGCAHVVFMGYKRTAACVKSDDNSKLDVSPSAHNRPQQNRPTFGYVAEKKKKKKRRKERRREGGGTLCGVDRD